MPPLPAPSRSPERPLRALILDAVYDSYQSVLAFLRVFDGRIEPGDEVIVRSSGMGFDVGKVGCFKHAGRLQ